MTLKARELMRCPNKEHVDRGENSLSTALGTLRGGRVNTETKKKWLWVVKTGECGILKTKKGKGSVHLPRTPISAVLKLKIDWAKNKCSDTVILNPMSENHRHHYLKIVF